MIRIIPLRQDIRSLDELQRLFETSTKVTFKNWLMLDKLTIFVSVPPTIDSWKIYHTLHQNISGYADYVATMVTPIDRRIAGRLPQDAWQWLDKNLPEMKEEGYPIL